MGRKRKVETANYDEAPSSDEEANDDSMVTREAGQIKSIYLENFMCHAKFELKFGSCVNYITGSNGSGKSAIVAALQLCLGATARNTGRGNAVGSLVREGWTGSAIVRVTLLNKGPDAYEPEKYGGKITVERKINRTGASTYALLDEHGQCKSTECKELTLILRKFNIYVDNPCCILTQEDAKRFINGPDSHKYEFFLKATGLERTLHELELVGVKLTEYEGQIQLGEQKRARKEEFLTKLQQELERLSEMDNYEQQITDIQGKILWLKVYNEEKKLKEAQVEYRRAERKASAEEKDISALSTVCGGYAEELQVATAALNASQQEAELFDAALLQCDKAVAVYEAERRHLEGQLRLANDDYNKCNDRVKSVCNKIHELNANAARNGGNKIPELLEEMNKLNDDKEALETKEAELRRRRILQRGQLQEVLDESTSLRDNLKFAQQEFDRADRELKSFRSNRGNQAVKFGADVAQVVEEIAKRKREFHEPVFGPVGLYVQLKEGSNRFTLAIERTINSTLKDFIVCNQHDSLILNDILRKKQIQLTIAQCASIPKYQVVEPLDNSGRKATTVLSCLSIDNDMVFNYIVDKTGLERIALASNEAEISRKYLITENGKARLCPDITSAVDEQGTSIRYVNGNNSSETYRNKEKNWLSVDTERYENELAARVKTTQDALEQQKQNMSSKGSEEVKRMLEQTEREISTVVEQLQRNGKNRVRVERELDDAQREAAVDTSAYEGELKDLENALNDTHRQVQALRDQVTEKEQEKDGLQRAKVSAQKLCDESRAAVQQLTDKLERSIARREKSARELREREARKTTLQEDLRLKERQCREYFDALREMEQTVVRECRELALSEKLWGDLDRPFWDGDDGVDNTTDNPTSSGRIYGGMAINREENGKNFLENRLNGIRNVIDDFKKNVGLQGRTKPVVIKEIQKVEAELLEDAEVLHNLNDMIISLKEDRKVRNIQWAILLKRCSSSVKKQFNAFMQKKGFAGTVQFDYEGRQLRIDAMTDNADENSKTKDVRTLSGGERSYVTFCLLMAFTRVIETPFRVMDEVDIYLDETTRRRVHDLLHKVSMETEQLGRQVIVLTPTRLSGVITEGNTTRVHAMPDPERGDPRGLVQQRL